MSTKQDKVVKLGDFTLVNDEKVKRAKFGSPGKEGKLYGGVGENATDIEILAEYDRLGGLIEKDGYKIKIGSFYDFEKKKPREEKEIIYIFRDILGKTVEVKEGSQIPLEVKAAEIAKAARGKELKKDKK